MFILQVRLPHTACDLVFFFFFFWAELVPELELVLGSSCHIVPTLPRL